MYYSDFLKSKIAIAQPSGIKTASAASLSPLLKPHQRDLALWAIRGGRRAVFAAFGGIMTVPYRAVKMGRFGIGCELSVDYWRDGVGYLKRAQAELGAPDLFSLISTESEANDKTNSPEFPDNSESEVGK